MDYQLLVVRGRSGSDALNLVDGVTTVGRHDDCQIRVKSSQVSRKHCEFFEKKGMLLVKDLGSANGTLVNGKKVEGQQVLEAGDEITIGGIKLRVAKIGEAPPPPKPAAPRKAASDTAVVEAVTETGAAIPKASDASDDEFEIDFDDVPDDETLIEAPSEISTAAVAPPAASASPKPPAASAPKPEPEPDTPATPDSADDAIADFLLDIKLDEEE